ncbi:cytochrome c3 family protein [Halodesulfovibrio aestuarii]|uniref:cytochrome c3 family protein n=1 Tax=Halodesulfovibrio aestuarii TaxID=126333 RepID=UPI0003F7AC0A
MLHRHLIPSVPLVISLFFAAICLAAAQEAPKDPVIIGAPAGAKIKKPKVAFPHATHAALQCEACHHMLKQNPEVYSCSSEGCHDLATPTSSEERKSIAYFRNAFHANSKASCNGCHKSRKKEGKSAGPTACKGCHTVK